MNIPGIGGGDTQRRSFASIASMASKTMKMGAGAVASLPNLPNLTSASEVEKRAKQAAEQKKQIAKVLSILEDVNLQCPESHTGLILAYTDSNLSPIMNPGIRFTWYSMAEEGMLPIDESYRAWYAPTVDDIGCVICAQCEDNFDHGYSRYNECGPIKADSLLCTLADSAVENGSFEAAGICVSLGLGRAPRDIMQGGPLAVEDIDSSSLLSSSNTNNIGSNSSSTNSHHHHVAGGGGMDGLGFGGATAAAADAAATNSSDGGSNGGDSVHGGSQAADGVSMTLSTVLSKKVAFLQFDGRSTVEVDENGIFISIPTFDTEATLLTPSSPKKKKSSLFGNRGNSHGSSSSNGAMGVSGKNSTNNNSAGSLLDRGDGKAAAHRSKFKTSRRGLRIPPSPLLRISCAQPMSLVLTVPVKRGLDGDDGSASTTNKSSSTRTSSSTPKGKHNDSIDATTAVVVASAASPAEAVGVGLFQGDKNEDNEDDDAKDKTSSDSARSGDEGGDRSAQEEEERGPPLSVVNPDKLQRTASEDARARTQAEEDERMARFLASSTLSIPWTYEGHHHSPEAYLDAEQVASLSAEEREEMLKEAERDSIIFASTIAHIAEFISSLPEDTNEICICFSCADRLVRDLLVVSMRALATLPLDCTRFERKRKTFPWLSKDTGEMISQAVAESNDSSEIEAKKMLKSKEEENLVLKRERNELTVQLVESREDLVRVKADLMNKQLLLQQKEKLLQQHLRDESTASENTSASSASAAAVGDVSSDLAATAAAAAVDAPTIPTAVGQGEYFKQLSSKIVELENKLAIASKKEAESARHRTDIEARNTKLAADVEKFQKSSEDNGRRLASLQSLYDMQAKSVQHLESDQESMNSQLAAQETQLKEMETLRSKLGKSEAQNAEIRNTLKAANSDGENYKKLIEFQTKQIEEAQLKLNQQEQTYKSTISNLEVDLAESMVVNKRQAREIEEQKVQIAEVVELKEQLAESWRERDKLNGQINHLQKKSESQTRDLKRSMRENATALAEFEKALVRKSEECNELYGKIMELEEGKFATAPPQQQIGDSIKKVGGKTTELASRVLTKMNTDIRRSFVELSGSTGTGAASESFSAGAEEAAGASSIEEGSK